MNAQVIRLAQAVRELPLVTAFLTGVTLILLVAVADALIAPVFSFSLLYLIGIGFVGWTCGSIAAVGAALLASAITAGLYNATNFDLAQFLWNVGMRTIMFCAGGWAIGELTRLYRQQGQLAEERTLQLQKEIEHHKTTAAQLAEAVERFEQVNNNITQLFWLTDLNPPKLHYVSPAYDQIWGRPRTELAANPLKWMDYVHPDDRPELIRYQAEQQQPATVDLRIVRPDNELRWLRFHSFPVRDGSGRVIRCAGIAEDITHRREAEVSLRLQNEVAARLSVATETGAALSNVLKTLLQLDSLQWACAHVLEPVTASFRFAAEEGKPVLFSHHLAEFPADSPQAAVIRKGQPVYLVREQFFPADADFGAIRSCAIIPLMHERQAVAAIAVGSETLETIPPFEQALLESIAAQAAGAIARIQAEQERRQLQNQLLDIADREQARIGQEIHDGLCQQLVSLAFDANSLQEDLAKAPRRTAAAARRLAQYLDQAITESRNLSRGLFPVRLEGDALSSALQELARSVEARFHVPCQVELQAIAVPAKNAMQLFRIAQEAINNAVKHGRPRTVSIQLVLEAQNLRMTIRDDGCGFRTNTTPTNAGMGLHIMEYRAHSIGATLSIDSTPGSGTTICCCLPSPSDQIISP